MKTIDRAETRLLLSLLRKQNTQEASQLEEDDELSIEQQRRALRIIRGMIREDNLIPTRSHHLRVVDRELELPGDDEEEEEDEISAGVRPVERFQILEFE